MCSSDLISLKDTLHVVFVPYVGLFLLIHGTLMGSTIGQRKSNEVGSVDPRERRYLKQTQARAIVALGNSLSLKFKREFENYLQSF